MTQIAGYYLSDREDCQYRHNMLRNCADSACFMPILPRNRREIRPKEAMKCPDAPSDPAVIRAVRTCATAAFTATSIASIPRTVCVAARTSAVTTASGEKLVRVFCGAIRCARNAGRMVAWCPRRWSITSFRIVGIRRYSGTKATGSRFARPVMTRRRAAGCNSHKYRPRFSTRVIRRNA